MSDFPVGIAPGVEVLPGVVFLGSERGDWHGRGVESWRMTYAVSGREDGITCVVATKSDYDNTWGAMAFGPGTDDLRRMVGDQPFVRTAVEAVLSIPREQRWHWWESW